MGGDWALIPACLSPSPKIQTEVSVHQVMDVVPQGVEAHASIHSLIHSFIHSSIHSPDVIESLSCARHCARDYH